MPDRSPTVASQACSVSLWGPWLLHLFTATGALCGLFSVLAVSDGSPRASLLWMTAALLIDAIDGPIARRIDVAGRMPLINGNSLDLVIDYVTCVLAPALFIYQFDLLPRPEALPLVGLICLTSLFSFSRNDLMTDDHYFRGFPAMWGLVAPMMFVLQSRPRVNVIATIILVGLTVAPVRVPHPVRTRDFRSLTMPILFVWLVALTIGTIDAPEQHLWVRLPLIAGTVYFVAISAWRSLRSDDAPLVLNLASQ